MARGMARMSAPTFPELPELPVFPSRRGDPDQPATFFPKLFALFTVLGLWRTAAIDYAAWVESQTVSSGSSDQDTSGFAPIRLTVTNEPDADYTLSSIDIWSHRRFTNSGAVS